MNDRDLYIDQILQEVAQRKAPPAPRGDYGHRDMLVDEILAGASFDVKPQETQPSSAPAAEVTAVPAKEQPVKEQPVKKRRSKKEDTLGILADITPWGERHAPKPAVNVMEHAPVPQSIQKTERFYSDLKKDGLKDEATQILYKTGGALHPAVEEQPAPPTGVLKDVPEQALREQVEEATRQLDPVDEPTRVLPEKRKEAALAAQKTGVYGGGTLAKADELTGQIRMAGFETAETEIDEAPWEEEFLSNREDKIRQFKMEGLDGDEPAEAATFEEDGEYHTLRDAAPLKYDLLARRRNVSVQLVTTLICFVLSLCFTAVGTLDITSGLLSDNPGVLMGLYLAALAVGVLVNFRTLIGGLGSLFKGGDQDTAAALAMCAALFQGVGFAVLGGADAKGCGPGCFVGCAALFVVMMNLWGKRILFSRMYANLELIANDRVKYGVARVEQREESFELGRGLAVGAPSVAFSAPAVDLDQFVYHSYAPDGVERSARWPLMLSPVFGLLGGVAAYLFAGGGDIIAIILQVLTGVCAGMIVSLPLTSMLSGNVLFYRFGKKLRRHRVMLSGYDGVEELRDTDVLALDASQLFPAGSITLTSIKSASNQSLDRSIMDVAGVVYMADCPLKSLFESIIQGKTNLLPQVDTLVYEEEMGISGWVMGYRVLVGTKKLMETHGILVPDVDYEEKYNQPGLKAVYLSTQGILSAVFLVKYSANEQIKAGLQKAVNGGLSLHIYSCDPNITREMICHMFKLPANAVRIMGAVPRRLYKQQIQSVEKTQATLSYEGNAGNLCRGVVAAMKLFRVLRLAGVLQVLFSLAGGVLLCAGLFLLSPGGLSGTLILLYQLITTLLMLLIPALMGR